MKVLGGIWSRQLSLPERVLLPDGRVGDLLMTNRLLGWICIGKLVVHVQLGHIGAVVSDPHRREVVVQG